MADKNAMDLIGTTPLIYLNKLSKEYRCKLYLKLEDNEYSSLYKRAIKFNLLKALKEKKINQSTLIIENTNGKNGILIANICAILSLKCILVLPDNTCLKDRNLIKLYGAIIILSKKSQSYLKTKNLLQKNKNSVLLSCLFHLKDYNYLQILNEVKLQLPEMDYFCMVKNLKYNFKDTPIKSLPRKQDISIFKVQTDKKIDDFQLKVDDIDAYHMTRLLASKEGIAIGPLSSYALFGAVSFIQKNKIKNMVVLCPDSIHDYSNYSYFFKNEKWSKQQIHQDIEYLFSKLEQPTFIKYPLWIKYEIYQDDLFKLKKTLLMDAKETLLNDPAATSLKEVIQTYPGFFATFCYRVAHLLWEKKQFILARTISEYAHSKTGIDIHPQAIIGHHFCIDHGTGIVIGQTCNIGHHVHIYHHVTLGAISLNHPEKLKDTKRHPTIKNHVIIYAGASILGGETIIGKYAIIGSNCFITSSIQDNAIIYSSNSYFVKSRKQKH